MGEKPIIVFGSLITGAGTFMQSFITADYIFLDFFPSQMLKGVEHSCYSWEVSTFVFQRLKLKTFQMHQLYVQFNYETNCSSINSNFK